MPRARRAEDDVSVETRRVVIADDSSAFRQALQVLLERTPGLTVVAEAANGWEALEQVEATSPDILLIDMMMPVMDGLFATRLIKERKDRSPGTFVIVMSIRGEEGARRAAAAAGADAFIWKGNFSNELHDLLAAAEPLRAGGNGGK
jgi:DNA-binding NarL/FixJ family response regulator